MIALDDYLAALASEAPTPGGGSAATVVGAAAAALVAMVARICAKSPRFAAQAPLASTLVDRAESLRADFAEGRVRDEAAFGLVVAAQALPKASEAERAARASALETALQAAAAEPLRAAQGCLDVLHLANRLLDIPNRNLASDVGCAGEFAAAALAACAYNVRVNHRYMHDRAAIERAEAVLARLEGEAAAQLQNVRQGAAALLRPASQRAQEGSGGAS